MISFIVPAHDEARLIGPTIAALHLAARACGTAYEIVVVDDASSDSTADIALQAGARVVTVQYRQIAATRNAGARASTGDRLLFVDADTLVDHAVVAGALHAIASGAVGGGAAVRIAGKLATHERIAEWLSIRLFRAARIAPGCFVFCTRVAFDAVGGFNETYFAGEDVAMSRALARHGRFVILRQPVLTSARKLRTFTATEHLRLVLRFALRGRDLLKSRRGLELWYGDRRDDQR